MWTVNIDGCCQKHVGALLWPTEKQLHSGHQRKTLYHVALPFLRVCVCMQRGGLHNTQAYAMYPLEKLKEHFETFTLMSHVLI